MNVLEADAKTLLVEQGLKVPAGQVVSTAAEAEAAATRLGGRVVVKAQVPASGRMKAGGIRFAATAAEAGEPATADDTALWAARGRFLTSRSSSGWRSRPRCTWA